MSIAQEKMYMDVDDVCAILGVSKAYSSYSQPEYSRGGARLFLSGRSGLDYNDSKTAWRRPPVGRHAFNCWE